MATLAAPLTLREQIYAYVDEAMDKGADPDLAYVSAFERLREAGRTEELLDTYGGELVCLIYQRRTHSNWGLPSLQQSTEADALVSRRPARGRPQKEFRGAHPVEQAAGKRRVDIAQLQSESALLSALVEVQGRWVAIADLTKQDCTALARHHRERAIVHGATAAFFSSLTERLTAATTVGQVYTEQDLQRLLESLR